MDISMCIEIRLSYILTHEENRNNWDKTSNQLQDGSEKKKHPRGRK